MTWQVCLKLAWIRMSRTGARLFLSALRFVLFRNIRHLTEQSPKRILVFRIGNIGDILVTVPALDAVRKRLPDAHITLATSPGPPGAPGAEHILPAGRWFDELLVYHTPDVKSWKGRQQLLKRLCAGRYELFVELSNQQSRLRDELRNMLVAMLAGCRFAVGFEISQQGRFLREQALHVAQMQEGLRIYRSVESSLSLDSYRFTPLPVSDSSRKAVSDLLRGLGIPDDEPFVVIHAGAKRHTNQWPKEWFARVADELMGRWGARVVLTGGAAERPLVDQITRQMRGTPTVICGQVDLPQMAALLERCSLYIGNDTGPMHIAAAVGTPTVSIFSARDFPGRWHPLGAGHTVLRRDAPCSPCFKEQCDRDLICLKAITVDDVLAAVERHLSRLDIPVAVDGDRR